MTEKIGPLEVGKLYRVPVVFDNRWKLSVPVLGPLHEDAEIINFPDLHWHIDWRFVSNAFWMLKTGGGRRIPHGTVLSVKNTTNEVQMRWRKCRRLMPELKTGPLPFASRIPWLGDLESACAGMTLKCGLVCPHRGLPLAGLPVVDGVVTCPGHGLAWRVKTGTMVKRA